MEKEHFTKQDIIDKCREEYNLFLSLDLIEDALKKETLEEAVDVIIIDSVYWNGEFQ